MLMNWCSRGGWLVEGPLAESPAEAAGILAGQRLIEIAGYPADLLSPLELSALMRGPAGSDVTLTVADPGSHPQLHLLELERAALPQPPVKVVSLHSCSLVWIKLFATSLTMRWDSELHTASSLHSYGEASCTIGESLK